MATEVTSVPLNEVGEYAFGRSFSPGFAASSRTPLVRVRARVTPGEEYKILDRAPLLTTVVVSMTDERGRSAFRYDTKRRGEVTSALPVAYRLYPSVPGYLDAPVRFVRPSTREPYPIGGSFDRMLSIDLKEFELGEVEAVSGLIQQVRGKYHRVRVYADRVEAAWVSMNAYVQAPEGMLMTSESPVGLEYVRCTELDGLSGTVWYVGVASEYNLIVMRDDLASGGGYTFYSNGRNDAYQLGPDKDFTSAALVTATALTELVEAKLAEGAELVIVRALRQSVFVGFDDGTMWAVGTDRNFAVLRGMSDAESESVENIVLPTPTELSRISELVRSAEGVVTHEVTELRSGGIEGDALCVVRRSKTTFEEDRLGVGVNTDDTMATGEPDALYTSFVERKLMTLRIGSYENPLRATSVEGVAPLVLERFERKVDLLKNGEWHSIDLKELVDAPVRYATQDEWDSKLLVGF